jgi:hypothetical protein
LFAVYTKGELGLKNAPDLRRIDSLPKWGVRYLKNFLRKLRGDYGAKKT